ncbi:MAG: ABC transporter permease [Deltaproteobacteria bacterium]|nr:ABC transporter permease [Deltaproteobacteria bacterium]
MKAFGLDVGHLALRVFARDFLAWTKYAKASAVGNFGEPLLFLLAMGYGVGRFVTDATLGVSYAEFVGAGLICSTAMYTATFECTFGTYTRLESQRTFDAILATPVSSDEIVAGELLFAATKSTIGSAVVLIVLLCFGLVSSPLALLALPAVFVASITFAGLSIIVAALSNSYEFFSYYFTLVAAPMFLFSGVFFPVESLSAGMQAFAWCLPLTPVVDLVRGLVLDRPTSRIWIDLVYLIVLGAAVFRIACWLFRRRLIK